MGSTNRPLLAWLGAPPGVELRAALEPHAELHQGWTPEARLVVAWAPSGTGVLQGLPRPLPEVLAVSEGAPQVRDRLTWIRAGATDLIGAAELGAALERRLRAPPGPPARPVPPPPVVPAPAPPARPPSAPAVPPRATRVPPPAEPRPLGLGPFAPLALPPAEPVEQVVHVLERLERYLRRRAELGRELGVGGEQALLALLHQRDLLWQSGDGASDPFGHRGATLEWPVGIRAADRPDADGPVDPGLIVGLGRDALTLAVDAPKGPRQRLVLDVGLGARGNVQLLVECRWQRRVAARRWWLGALVLDLRRRTLG